VTLQNAVSFRAAAGLTSDQTFVRASYNDAATFPDRTLGLPLTTGEAAEINRQMDAQLSLIPTLEAAAKLPGFGTAYFERDTLHIVTTGDLASSGSALAQVAPSGAEVLVSKGSLAQADLLALRDRVVGGAPALAAKGVHLGAVGVDPQTARLAVTVADTDDLDSARATLNSSYGQDLVVTQGEISGSLFACNSRYDCGTKGGLAAAHAVGGGTLRCTTAFVVRDNNTSTRYLMTAGHCISESGGSGSTVKWTNEAGTLTWGKNVRYYFNANFDEGIFNLGTTLPSAYNQYYASSSFDIRSIDHAELLWAAMPAGLYVCRTGRTSSWGCGTVHQANMDWYDGSMWHYGVWQVTQVSKGGDSGAGYIAFGQHSGTYPAGILLGGDSGLFPTYTYYYPAFDDEFISVHACTTAAC
jgi:hypothetical protein